MKKFFLLVALALSFASYAFAAESQADTSPSPYEEDEFPLWVNDLRRFEIISLGSLPFTMLGTSLVYSGIMTATGQLPSFPNPFDKTSPSLSTEDQLRVLGIAAGVSIGIGLTDLIITQIKRAKAKRIEASEEEERGHVTITPLQAKELLNRRSVEAF